MTAAHDPAPEFTHPLTLDAVRRLSGAVSLSADIPVRTALAKRFGLIALDRLDARWTLRTTGDIIDATGELTADVVQPCVVTDDPVPDTIHESVHIRFVPAVMMESGVDEDSEIELDHDALDVISYSGAIDLGEATAQSLALALNPYPRSAHADAAIKERGIKTEEEAGAFGALAALRDTMRKTND